MAAIETRDGVLLDEICEITPGGTFGNILGIKGDKVLGVRVRRPEDVSCGEFLVEGWVENGSPFLCRFSIVCEDVDKVIRFNR